MLTCWGHLPSFDCLILSAPFGTSTWFGCRGYGLVLCSGMARVWAPESLPCMLPWSLQPCSLLLFTCRPLCVLRPSRFSSCSSLQVLLLSGPPPFVSLHHRPPAPCPSGTPLSPQSHCLSRPLVRGSPHRRLQRAHSSSWGTCFPTQVSGASSWRPLEPSRCPRRGTLPRVSRRRMRHRSCGLG